MFNKIATVTVYVDNQEESAKFWEEKIGFEVQKKNPMGPNAFWMELSPPGAASCITLYPKSMMENWNETKVGIVFQTDDIREAYAKLQANGVDIDEPKELGFGIFTQFRDPDGNEFGLRQHK
ncbi:VOC family protein [Paenibacillus sp. GCM10027628]|uniref:VOC family protein n=1 Tax=Paenibacillus sp. GCM10027628 TaxID=3273413 RepID=UPI003641EF41